MVPECDYWDRFNNTNLKVGYKMYPDDIQDRQIHYVGDYFARMGKTSKLALGEVRTVDWTFDDSTVKLWAYTRRESLSLLGTYLSQVVPYNVEWSRVPGFQSVTTNAWLLPAEVPAILIKPTRSIENYKRCSNFKHVARFIECYEYAIIEGVNDPSWAHHPGL